MAYKVVWLPKAEKRYDEIIEWLKDTWTDKEIVKFITRTDEVIELLSENPDIF